MKRLLLTFVIALGVGGVASYFSRSSARQVREVETKRALREEAGGAREWSGDDLVRATQERMKNQQGGNSPLARQLAEWSTDEIRAALEESVRSPDSIFRVTPGARVEYELILEWMKRDHEAAAAWLETVESDYAKARLVPMIIGAWPKEDAMAGLDFFIKHRKPGSAENFSLYAKAFNQAAASGPKAVDAVLSRFLGEHLLLYEHINLEFPAGFDFRTLVAGDEFGKLEARGQSLPLQREWSDQDPAGAFSWLMEKGGIAKAWDMAGMYGEEAGLQRLKWLGGEMNKWSAEQRKELADHALLSWSSEPEALKYLAQGMKNPALAEELRIHSIQAIYEGKAKQAMRVLGDIPDPSRRIELLLAAERSPVLENEGASISFPAAGEASMRSTLREWNATEAQIDTIIQRFKP